MRRPWIKIETNTPDKPEICSIATTLRMDADAVLGKLIRLWSWVEVNQPTLNDLGVTKEFIDKLVGRKGFAAAMISAGWLLKTEGKLTLKNVDRHSSGLAKIRALTAVRVAIHRRRKTKQRVSDEAEALFTVEKAFISEPQVVYQDKDVKSVKSTVYKHKINDLVDLEAYQESLNNVTAIKPPVDLPQVAPTEAIEPVTNLTADVIEEVAPPSRKRKARQVRESEDQPLLF
jgi:hypothetical protein